MDAHSNFEQHLSIIGVSPAMRAMKQRLQPCTVSRQVRRAIGMLLYGLLTAVALAACAHYPTEPLLRLETSMHTAPIRRMDVDQAERFLVTGSYDKTVRIWELKTGRLMRTLR